MFGVVARTHRFTETYYLYKRQKRLVHDHEIPEVFERIGPPGTGKTKWMDDVLSGMSGLSTVLRETVFKLILIVDINFDTSKCPF